MQKKKNFVKTFILDEKHEKVNKKMKSTWLKHNDGM